MIKFLTTDLKEIPFIRHGFFTRMGGVSTGIYTSLNCGLKSEDRPTHVMTNRSKAAGALDLTLERLVIAKQVHGTKTIHVMKPWVTHEAPEADALVTAEAGIGLGILTADCAPVLFVDKKAKVIGAAHAGWRGAVGGVLESTIECMKTLGAKPENIEAAIGPCIGPNSYEVKADFLQPFIDQDANNQKFFKSSPRKGHFIFNLPGYCASRLKLAGVGKVHDIGQDTLTNETSFFSNRRAFLQSEKSFGLQISIIAIK